MTYSETPTFYNQVMLTMLSSYYDQVHHRLQNIALMGNTIPCSFWDCFYFLHFSLEPPSIPKSSIFFSFSFFFSVKLRSERCNHLYFWNGKLPQRKLGCGNALLPHPEKYLSLFHPILAIFIVFFISKNKHKHKNPTITIHQPTTKLKQKMQ